MEAHNPDVSICIQHALSPGHIKGKNELQFFSRQYVSRTA